MTMGRAQRVLFSLFTIILPVLVHAQQDQPLCLSRSCYPATGNLLVGRQNNLQASSTCGLRRPERFCVVSNVRDEKNCFECDSSRPWSENNKNSHNITNIVSTFTKERLGAWWQAENGVEEASIQLDLDAEFHFTHLIITFKTFRPRAMYIERSFDFGKSWLPYRYFAEDCQKSFPGVPMGPVKSLENPTICEERYSNVLPASRGEVVFKVLPPHMRITDPYSPAVQDLLKLTNLRVIFKELHTLGDDLLDQRREINEKYYYAVYDMVVRGSCSCYGHASNCVPSNEEDRGVNHMVYSRCECKHNTKGKNCDKCADFYNDRPWVPARGDDSGECKECQCHGHATSCHFDPAVYHSRGNVSGGVCDNCMHNTDGLNCELCASHFFQDPSRDLRDTQICQPCDCDPTGTQNNGECDMRNDHDNGLIAGRCKCKENVGGSRCERCEAGYWDFTDAGCVECECNILGTYDNQGCNQQTGFCTCKRFVTGRNCDQCLANYWGLNKDDEGCLPCGCDIGGSVDNDCDAISGQCNCKMGITGRACDQAIPGFFVTDLDYLRYEAELADGGGKAQVVVREVVPGSPVTWTGPGFMRLYEKDYITFTIDNIPYSMSYDIIIRYETQMPNGWDDVRVSITRPGPPDTDGPCSNQRPQDDYPGATLSQSGRYYIVRPEICFEKGKTYYVKLDFPHYQAPDDTPNANILIDSIALIPVYIEAPVRVVTNPIPPAEMIYCNDFEYDANEMDNMPDECKRFMFSIGAAIQNKALVCDCDPTGSESSICADYGGQCKCKPNIIGRKCDQCSPGTYGFGPFGCTLCNCHAQGARDNFCDHLTGQCLCLSNINGRTCDRCGTGRFNFPNCERCQCNGHAVECEDAAGRCIDCADNTAGQSCDRCVDGFYGDASLGSGTPCEKCMCPGGEGSGYQHADTCTLDPWTKQMKCDCPPQFAGDRCEECALNHFGNPMEANGTCTSCAEMCNHNLHMDVPGSCDPVDGRCTICQFNTEGDNCENCANGFFGDAVAHSCVACVCNWLGADRDASMPCDRVSGECPCLPNVVGHSCDQCAPDHWKLASGVGCEPCECDDEGSHSPQCNEFDGQCHCIEGRGGKRCDQCIDLHYGDPIDECFPCDCNGDGSETLQCDPYTGQCPCFDGITGLKCDRCDRGTTGDLPNCVPCGECFDNWDDILKSLRVQTDDMLTLVNATKSEGAVGVYDDQFLKMNETLEKVRMIIDNFNQSEADVAHISMNVDDIRMQLNDALGAIKTLELNFMKTNRGIADTENDLSVLKNQIEDLIEHAKSQKKRVDGIIQEDIVGAYKTIEANNKISRDALMRAEDAKPLITEALKLQNDTIKFLQDSEAKFTSTNQLNKEILDNFTEEINAITNYALSDINQKVCDRKSPFVIDEFCDATCGGGGCDTCGLGESCTTGAQGMVSSALTLTSKAEDITANKSMEVNNIIEELNDAALLANSSQKAAMESHTAAKAMADEVNLANVNIKAIQDQIADLLGQEKATPDDVIKTANEVLSLSIPIDLEAIEAIARQINETIQNLTNIDQILNETAADLITSDKLKERADDASNAAKRILQQVTDLNKKLSDARNAQNNSVNAIEEARNDIAATRDSLKMIGDVMTAAVKKAEELMEFAERLFVQTRALSNSNTNNAHRLDQAEKQAALAQTLAAKAAKYADEIKTDYLGVSDDVLRQHNESLSAHERAIQLHNRAGRLASSLSTHYRLLTTIDGQLLENNRVMTSLQKEIDRLTVQVGEHMTDLNELENYHNKCEATDTTTL